MTTKIPSMKETYNPLNFTKIQNDFQIIGYRIKDFWKDTTYNPKNELQKNLNTFLRIYMYNYLELEYNYPHEKQISIFMNRFNLNQKDSISMIASRNMFFQINFISLFYFNLEAISKTIIKLSGLEEELKDKKFKSMYNLILEKSKPSALDEYKKLIFIFSIFRNCFHSQGIYNGKTKTIRVNGRDFIFTNKKSPNLPYSDLIFLISEVTTMLDSIIKSKYFKKTFLKKDTS